MVSDLFFALGKKKEPDTKKSVSIERGKEGGDYPGSPSKTVLMENFDVVTETPSVAVVRALLNPNVQCPTDNLFSGLDSASTLQRPPSRSATKREPRKTRIPGEENQT